MTAIDLLQYFGYFVAFILFIYVSVFAGLRK